MAKGFTGFSIALPHRVFEGHMHAQVGRKHTIFL